MGKTYYLIAVEQGVEPAVLGPFETEDQRDNAARHVYDTQEEDDSLFWTDIEEAGVLTVGPYIAGFFWQEPENNPDQE